MFCLTMMAPYPVKEYNLNHIKFIVLFLNSDHDISSVNFIQ